MTRVIACIALLLVGAGIGFFAGSGVMTAQGAEESDAITDLEAWVAEHETWDETDLAGRLAIIAELSQARRVQRNAANGFQSRLLLAHARENGMDPETDLVRFVEWLGSIASDSRGAMNLATRQLGSVNDLVQLYGSLRLYQDEAFLNGDSTERLRRVKELWDKRELAQGQCYDLTRQIAYAHLAQAEGDIDQEIKLFGELHRAGVMDWAGASSVHTALLVRGLSKPELDTPEKKIAWLNKVADNRNGDLSWMIVSSRRVVLAMQAIGPELEKLDTEGRAKLIDDWRSRGLLQSSDVTALKAAYCVP